MTFLTWCILIAGVVVLAACVGEWWLCRSRVFADLDAAEFNGYFAEGCYLSGATAAEIACDLTCYSSECEDIDPAELVPHVRAWLKKRGLK